MINICKYKLRSCVWELTLDCCYACNYCGSLSRRKMTNELSTEECLNVVHQLSLLGCERVTLIGGEVFMRPDWSTITKELAGRGIRVAIVTNGYMISEELIATIRSSGVESVAVSFDGPEEIHDRHRQKGSYECALKAIDTLAKNYVSVSAISTLYSDNVDYLYEMMEILKQTGIFAWRLHACTPKDCVPKENLLTDIDFRKVISFVDRYLENPYFRIGIADSIGYHIERQPRARKKVSGKIAFPGCRAGLTNISIDCAGNVRGCESMHDDYFIEGNLREKTLSDIWNAKDAFSYNRNFTVDCLTGKCKECEYGSRCAGGCRSYNFFTHNKLYESKFCQKDNY